MRSKAGSVLQTAGDLGILRETEWRRRVREDSIKEVSLELGLGGGEKDLKRQGMAWGCFPVGRGEAAR